MNDTEAKTFESFSIRNAMIVESSFECDCKAYEDIFTYKRWRAQGFQVQKGSKAVKISTYAPITKVNDDGEKVIVGKRPWVSNVFCRCQVKPIDNGPGEDWDIAQRAEEQYKDWPNRDAKTNGKKPKIPQVKESAAELYVKPNSKITMIVRGPDNGAKIGNAPNWTQPQCTGEILGVYTDQDVDTWIKARKPYNGPPKLTTHAWLKSGYRSKNPAGGLRCKFSTAKGY